jgi:uncharacterized protein (TIGR02246 family)
MTKRSHSPLSGLDQSQTAAIEEAVKQCAWQHLQAENAAAALDCYVPDALVASDGSLYSSFEHFAKDARQFYDTLGQVDLAVWDEMHIQVVARDIAVLTATVRWSSTDIVGLRTDLKGVWTAVYVERGGRWKICTRHESFEDDS